MLKRITYTWDGKGHEPRVGLYLRSSRSTYHILDCRKMKTRDGAKRYALGVVNVDNVPPGAFWNNLVWDKRKKR